MASTLLNLSGQFWLALERLATWKYAPLAQLPQYLRRLDDQLLGLRAEEPRTDEEVLAWADRIAATQPGFAADLRAAVLHKQGLDELRAIEAAAR